MTQKETYKDFGFATPPLSYWIASTDTTDYPMLKEDINVDVAIVGGGLVGITTAYLLKKEGLKVAVIEADRICQGTTGHTTAKITSQHELIYAKLKKDMGHEKAQQYADANQMAIEFIANLVDGKNIDCDFSRQSAYVYTQDDKYIQQIQDEVEAAKSLGIKADYLEEIPLGFKIKAAERFENQAQFHPRKYVLSIAKDISGDGCHIFEKTRCVDVHEGNPCTILTEHDKKITAKYLVIASHFPFFGGDGFYFTRQYAERSYSLNIKMKEKYPGGMYITAENPGRSIRFTPYQDGELILIQGEHHKTGQGENMNIHYENLKNFASQNFTIEDIPYRWSTQDYTTIDEVPYVGHLTSDTPNIFVATGFKKWGMTNSTASAMILRDLIVKGESPWAPVYSPQRDTSLKAAKTFVVENVDVAKHLIGDKLMPTPDFDEIKPGEAKTFVVEGEKVGGYRDEKGQLHVVDTTCTHMGCDLHWNAAELSWDCPCHGSRFTYEGDIIEGPALKSLRTHEERFNP